jgi:hypothetical protein
MSKGKVLTIPIAEKYKDFLTHKHHQYSNPGGRDSGKTTSALDAGLIDSLAFPDHDGIVFKAHYSDFRSTDFAEIRAMIEERNLSSIFEIIMSPFHIRRRDGRGDIYFAGAEIIGLDSSRTHGLKTRHPLLWALFSESQQFRTEAALTEAMASVRRNFTEKKGDGEIAPEVVQNWWICVQGNPPQSSGHWYNSFVEKKKADPEWETIFTTYLDVAPFLNDMDLAAIRREKVENPDNYAWQYEGKVGGGWGTCYPMLEKGKQLIPLSQAVTATKNMRVVAVVVGCDGAVQRDCTSFAPMLILEDGTAVLRQDDCFRYDPKKSGVLSSYPLCAPGGPAWRWWAGYAENNIFHPGIRDRYESLLGGGISVPFFFFVDSAAPELREAIRFHFSGERVSVRSVVKGSIIDMVERLRDVFGKELAKFIDCGNSIDYLPPRSQSNPNRMPRAVRSFPHWDELCALRMDPRTGLKYDDTIPNDNSDAVTYALWSWFANPENIAFGSYIGPMVLK